MTYCFSVLQEKGGLQLFFIPAVHGLIDREGVLHIYKPLGNLTDIQVHPYLYQAIGWTLKPPGEIKLVGFFSI